MRASALFSALLVLPLSGCMTSTVIHDARHPKESDNAPWANYLLLPVTVPADIATSPVQLIAFVSWGRGERSHVPDLIPGAGATNAPTAKEPSLAPPER